MLILLTFNYIKVKKLVFDEVYLIIGIIFAFLSTYINLSAVLKRHGTNGKSLCTKNACDDNGGGNYHHGINGFSPVQCRHRYSS